MQENQNQTNKTDKKSITGQLPDITAQPSIPPQNTLQETESHEPKKEKKLLKKKRKLAKKIFIEDEADEENENGEILNREDFEEDEKEEKYESSFIDDEENEINDITTYRNYELNQNYKEQPNHTELINTSTKPNLVPKDTNNEKITLVEIEKILNVEFVKEEYTTEESNTIKEKLDRYQQQIIKGANLTKYELDRINNERLIFENIYLKDAFLLIVTLVYITGFKYNLDELQSDMWDDLDYYEIEQNISTCIIRLIRQKMDFSGFVINLVRYYLLKKLPDIDMEKTYELICNKLKIMPDPENIKFKILKNPGQTKKIYEEESLKSYKLAILKNAEFYKDKPSDYDEKLTLQQQIEDKKQKELINSQYEYLENCKNELLLIENNYEINKAFDGDFDISNKSDFFNTDSKFNCHSFGGVIMMDKSRYTEETEKNINIHLPHYIPTVIKGMLFYLKNYLGYKHVQQIIMAHEHGKNLKKCHYQLMIKFYERIQGKIPPGSFNIRDPKDKSKKYTYLIIFRSVKKNEFALENYVKKKDELVPENKYLEFKYEKKYTLEELYRNFNINELLGDKEKIPIEIEEKNDKHLKPNDEYWDMVLSTPNLDYTKLMNMARSKNEETFTKFVLSQHKNIILFNKLALQEEPPTFKWTFPEYVITYIKNYENKNEGSTDKYKFFKYAHDYFKTYCEHNDPSYLDPLHKNRKTGFMVFGPSELGKTTFFTTWCGLYGDPKENPFIIYCRNTINWEAFEKKLNTVQMIILDDIFLNPYHMELIKALGAGEPTYVRSLYIDDKYFKKSCPCIFLTNKDWVYDMFQTNDELYSRFSTMSISFYLGPDGTKPQRTTVHFRDNPSDIYYKEYKEKQKEKKNNKKEFWLKFKNFSKY